MFVEKDEEGKIWFIDKEVVEILGYKETAIRKIVASRIRKSHKRRLTLKEFNVTATVTLKIPNRGLTIYLCILFKSSKSLPSIIHLLLTVQFCTVNFKRY